MNTSKFQNSVARRFLTHSLVAAGDHHLADSAQISTNVHLLAAGMPARDSVVSALQAQQEVAAAEIATQWPQHLGMQETSRQFLDKSSVFFGQGTEGGDLQVQRQRG